MAIPTFNQAGSGLTDAGGAWDTAADTWPASTAAGTIVILHILQDGATGGAVALTGATNVEALDGTDNTWTKIPGPNADESFPVGATGRADRSKHLLEPHPHDRPFWRIGG